MRQFFSAPWWSFFYSVCAACSTNIGRPGDYLPCDPNGVCASGHICTTVARLGEVCLNDEQRQRLCEHPETCNGEDDDCDGERDEGLPECCEPMATRTCGSTVAMGMQTCGDDRRWNVCARTGTVPAERCNGRDDDGNGLRDELWTGLLGRECTVGIGSCTRFGRFICARDERGVTCNGTPGMPTTETCDGADNDCNGFVDDDILPIHEGFPHPPCRTRIAACIGGGMVEVQSRINPPRIDELCNGIDDDCDGEVDESWRTGPQAIGASCDRMWDACRGRSRGVYACVADGRGTTCVAPEPNGTPAMPERCNGDDDDCDGVVDGTRGAGGASVPLTQSCYPYSDRATLRVTGCRTGTTTCVRGVFGTCDGAVVPGPEDGTYDAATGTWSWMDGFERPVLAPWAPYQSDPGSVTIVDTSSTGGTRALRVRAETPTGALVRSTVARPFRPCGAALRSVELTAQIYVEAWRGGNLLINAPAFEFTGPSGYFVLFEPTAAFAVLPDGSRQTFNPGLSIGRWTAIRIRFAGGTYILAVNGTEVARIVMPNAAVTGIQFGGVADGLAGARVIYYMDDVSVRTF